MNQQVVEAAHSVTLRHVLLRRGASQEARHKFLCVLNFTLYLQMTTRASEMRDTHKILAGNPMKGISNFRAEVS
jgi:hypothetical protein